ncbi:unnamed protein product [Lactuca virosa]|uniref:Secreted protein n=1 Tax=Lactuca virosa TaxID=75947 RepID=A0AAU9NFM6_9ASTR|nr:unnamed protein product [Lactuca virosa]
MKHFCCLLFIFLNAKQEIVDLSYYCRIRVNREDCISILHNQSTINFAALLKEGLIFLFTVLPFPLHLLEVYQRFEFEEFFNRGSKSLFQGAYLDDRINKVCGPAWCRENIIGIINCCCSWEEVHKNYLLLV